ncbi:NAPDH-dependent diflavin reductase [Ascosphaera pollenicola]|nr:NAPDH-dependent diflavin reductase [Ascosphaera pollenicola]
MSFGGAKRRRLPGQEFSWEAGGGEQDTAPTPLFPKYRVPRARPLSPVEVEQVDLYKQLREKIHDGPYYVVLSGKQPVGSANASSAESAAFDPFQGMATYGQRYVKKTKTLPKLAGRPYLMNLFPKELWKTLDPKYVGLSSGLGTGALGTRKRGFEEEELADEEDDDGENREGGEKGEADLLEDEDEDGEDELVDNDFEEDDDDMADDYNAEQYFDGGDDDAGDFDSGGGDMEMFNFAARKLRKRILQLGAEVFFKHGEADEQHSEGNDATFIPWSQDLRQALLDAFPLPQGQDPIPENAQLVPDWVLCPYTDESQSEGTRNAKKIDLSRDERPLPHTFEAKLLQNQRVTPKSHWQDTRHLILTTLEAMSYGPGDIIHIFPRNLASDVDFLISHMKWEKDADTPLQIVPGPQHISSPSSPSPLPFLQDKPGFTLRELLTDYLDVNAVPRRSFFSNLSHFAKDTSHKERLLEFASSEFIDELYDYTTRPRRSILEVLQEFHSVTLPWQQVLTVLPTLRSRQFSIASGGSLKKTIDGQTRFDLLVAIIKYRTVIKKTREGTCTRYIAGLPCESTLRLKLERGAGLNVSPQQLVSPSLLIGPGTGIAPLRAFLWEKAALAEKYREKHGPDARVSMGPNVLLFGGRNATADFYFREEWEELARVIHLDVLTAFSRDQKTKMYVQDRLRESEDIVQELVQHQQGLVYVCGSSGRMPKAVREALKDCLKVPGTGTEGQDSLAAAEKYLNTMEKEGRYKQETW